MNQNNNLSLLKQLLNLANIDKDIKDIEFDFLLNLAYQLGVSKKEFIQLFEQYIEFLPPKLEFDRIIQFHRLVLVMNVDQETSKEEIEYIKQAGIKLGLNPLATNEVLSRMNNYPNKILPPDVLIGIFKSFHN